MPKKSIGSGAAAMAAYDGAFAWPFAPSYGFDALGFPLPPAAAPAAAPAAEPAAKAASRGSLLRERVGLFFADKTDELLRRGVVRLFCVCPELCKLPPLARPLLAAGAASMSCGLC